MLQPKYVQTIVTVQVSTVLEAVDMFTPTMDRLAAQLVHSLSDHDTGGGPEFGIPNLASPTGIGILVAISGNVLISLALNLQKLAHRKVEHARANNILQHGQTTRNGEVIPGRPTSLGDIRESELAILDGDDQGGIRLVDEPDVFSGNISPSTAQSQAETQHLLPLTDDSRRNYGSRPKNGTNRQKGQNPTFLRRLFSLPSRLMNAISGQRNGHDPEDTIHSLHGVEGSRIPNLAANGGPTNGQNGIRGSKLADEGSESDYLRSKLWWLGFFLMNVGEVGNFISYGFAPASVVAPLGTFALIANCLFAPLMQGERFRKMDLLGVTIAIIGAVTVVLSCNTSDDRLDPDALLRAISKRPFILFSCVYVVGAVILATLSEGRIGRDWVIVDIGLCALFGGFTVLSTKAISTLLTLEWFVMFTQWITYPILLILIGTGIGQIRYLNRALMRFDSKVVIPIQFVLFTLSAIIGSAVLYGDFEKATVSQLLNFFYGCTATFLGVFIIAWVPSSEDEAGEEDVLEEAGETSSAGLSSERARSVVGDRSGLGTFGRKNRVRVLSHEGRDAINLRKRKSIVSMAVSPAQQLLLVHTPPRDIADRRFHDEDIERDQLATPDSFRRRTISWFGEDVRRTDTRDSSVGARDRSGIAASPPGQWV